jgi:hypothetical protein
MQSYLRILPALPFRHPVTVFFNDYDLRAVFEERWAIAEEPCDPVPEISESVGQRQAYLDNQRERMELFNSPRIT